MSLKKVLQNKALAAVAWLIRLKSTKNLFKKDGIKQFEAYTGDYISLDSRVYDFDEAINKGYVSVTTDKTGYRIRFIHTPTDKGLQELGKALNINIIRRF